MLDLLKDLWGFMRERKKFWLAPIIIVMVLLGALIVPVAAYAAWLIGVGAARGGHGPIAIGSAAALVSGIGAIWLFLRILEHKNFYVFSYYLLIAGGGFLSYLALRP